MINKVFLLLALQAILALIEYVHSIDHYYSFTKNVFDSNEIEYEISILNDFFAVNNVSELKNNYTYKNKPILNDDGHLDVKQLIQKYGYPLEVYHVITEDGYILELHRIPHAKDGKPANGRPAVFLQHGLISSSSDWIVMGPSKGLGYILADAGYDVWMGNYRGNRYSRKHTNISPRNSEFWYFSWHEMGIFDLPAMIDKVLEITRQRKLFYIGHSQGTTAFFVMCSERPEYNDKIESMFALAPIAYMSNMTSPFVKILAKFIKQLVWIIDKIGMNEFLPNDNIIKMAGQRLCYSQAIAKAVCSNILFLIAGFNSRQLNTTMLPVLLGHTPAGSSTRQLLHYAQEVRSGYFRQYDFGPLTNMVKYRQLTPPEYQLEEITAPISLHYSQNDWLSHPTDIDKLSARLPNVIGKFLNPDSQFNHLDYLWGIDANKYLYPHIMDYMQRSITKTKEENSTLKQHWEHERRN